MTFPRKIALAFVVTALTAGAKDAPKLPSEVLFKKFKPAVVKITTKVAGLDIDIGSGFFVGPNGELVTNKHVLHDFIDIEHVSASVQLSDGRKFEDFKIAQCGDERDLDICLIQLPVPSPTFFKLTEASPAQGEKIFVIGHPLNLDYTVSDGVLSALRNDRGWSSVQISAPVSPGNSGGPIYDERGTLVGMTTATLTSKSISVQNINQGIAAKEIADYINKYRVFRNSSEFKREKVNQTKADVSKWKNEIVENAYQRLGRREDVSSILSTSVKVKTPLGQLIGYLPPQFTKCAPGKGKGVLLECTLEKVSFTLKTEEIPSGKSILSLRGKPIGPPGECLLVKVYEQSKQWEKLEPTLTPQQKALLKSQPGVLSCALLGTGALQGKEFCEYTTKNRLIPMDSVKSVVLQFGNRTFEAFIWVADPNLQDYFFEIPKLFLSSLKQVGTNSLAVSQNAPSDRLLKRSASSADLTSEQLYEKACENRDKKACVDLSVAYSKKPGRRSQAIYFADRACALGEAKGCTFLGISYHLGRGVASSNEKALQYLSRACDLHAGEACRFMGVIRSGGHIRMQ